MSDKDQADSVADVRRSLGAELKTAREDRKLSVEEVASRLMLSPQIVGGLEAGDYKDLPELTFIRGYLVAYLRLLDKPQSLLEAFDETNTSDYTIKLSTSVVRASCSGDGWARCISVGLVVLLVAAIGLWLVEQSFRIIESSGLLSGNPVVVSEKPATTSPAGMDEAPEALTMADTEEDTEEDTVVEPLVSGEPDVELSGEEDVQPESAAAVEEVAEKPANLLLRFNGDSWVEIRNADDVKLAAGVYSEGQEIVLNDDKPPFSVVLGNAGHVYIEYEGQEVAGLRKAGAVARLSLGKAGDVQ